MLTPRQQQGTQTGTPLDTINGEIGDIEHLREGLKSRLDNAQSTPPTLEVAKELFSAGSEFLRQLRNSQATLNQIFSPDPTRDSALGQIVLHSLIADIASRERRSESEKDLLNIALRAGKATEALSSINELRSVYRMQPNTFEEDRGTYAAHAPAPLHAQYEATANDLIRLNRALQNENDEQEYQKLITEQSRAISLEESLFNQITVDPFSIKKLLTDTGFSLLLPREGITAAGKFIASCDGIRASTPTISVDIPTMDQDARWSAIKLELPSEWLKDAAFTTSLLEFYSEARFLMEAGEHARISTHGLPQDEAAVYKTALRYRPGSFFPRFVAAEVPGVSLEIAANALLHRGYCDGARGALEACRPIEDVSQSLAGLNTILKYGLTIVDNPAERSHFMDTIRDTPSFNGPAATFLTSVFDCIQKSRTGDTQAIANLANLINGTVEKWAEVKRAGALPAVFLSTLHVISQDSNLARKLRKQITTFDQLREVLKESPAFFQNNLNDIQRKLSNGMAGYFGQQKIVDRVRKVVHEFLRVNQRRDLIEGRAANEVIKNGILLDGEPGSGKTFLAICIAEEFGLPKFFLSPKECIKAAKKKQPDTQMSEEELLMTGQKLIIEEAIETSRKRPCCLIINELDEIAADRLNTNIPERQRAKTFETLRFLEEIRENNVGILLIGTTNHRKRIDEAIVRDGRFDVVIKVPRQTIDDVAEVIAGILLDLKSPVELPEEQLKALSAIAIDLKPLSIKQALFGAEILNLSEDKTSLLSYQEMETALIEKVEDRAFEAEDEAISGSLPNSAANQELAV